MASQLSRMNDMGNPSALRKPDTGHISVHSHGHNRVFMGAKEDRHSLQTFQQHGSTVYSNANKIIQIPIPTRGTQHIMDWFKTAVLTFIVTMTDPGAPTYFRLASGIWNIIESMTLRVAGGNVIQRCDAYGQYVGQDYFMRKDSHADTFAGPLLYGVDSAGNRDTNALTPHQYALPILLSALYPGGGKVLPTNLISADLVLEIVLADQSVYIETDYALAIPANAVEVSDVRIWVDTIEPKQSLRTHYSRLLSSGGLMCPFRTYASFTHNVTGGGETHLSLGVRASSLHAVLATLRNAADINDVSVNDRTETWLNPTVVNYQMKEGNVYIPPQPVEVSTYGGLQWVNHSYVLLGRWRCDGCYRNNPLWTRANALTPGTASKFIAVVDFDAHRDNTMDQDCKEGVYRLTHISNGGSSINMEFVWNIAGAVPAQGFSALTFVIHDTMFKIASDGQIHYTHLIEPAS